MIIDILLNETSPVSDMNAVFSSTDDSLSANLRATKSEPRPVQSEPSLRTLPDLTLFPAFGITSARSFKAAMKFKANCLASSWHGQKPIRICNAISNNHIAFIIIIRYETQNQT